MNKALKFILLSSLLFCLPSCQSYLWHIQKSYVGLMLKKVSIAEALKSPGLTEGERGKLKLIEEIKKTAKEKWKRKVDEGIYSSYVPLDRPYVTYLLRVSPRYELKPYTWDFAVTGEVPYLGFFDRDLAVENAENFKEEGYDTYVRGVNAFSTLGWFKDPVYSSMLSGSESGFVTMVFHELAHSVLFFKGHINFNERFAEFIGRKSAELFYTEKEGADSETLKNLKIRWQEELLFSEFMSKEIVLLEQWYKDNRGSLNLKMKKDRLKVIQNRFVEQIQPQLTTKGYDYFPKRELNNAMLLSYRSYNYRMDEFEKLYTLSNKNMSQFISHCESLKEAEDPEKALSKLLASLSVHQERKE